MHTHADETQPEPFDALAVLRKAGHPVDLLNEGQRRVFAELSAPEVELLNSIKRRLEAVSGEVEGHDLKIV